MIGRRCVALALAVIAAVGLTACSASSQGGSGTNFVAGDGTITLVPPAKRQAAVTLTGTTLEGAPFDLAAYRGNPVVLNVWGSWCAPCRKEAPELQKAAVALAAKGVKVIGINTQETDKAQALAYQRTFGITYPSVDDSGGQAVLALRGAVSAKSIPSTVVVDASGRLAARISGTTTAVTLADLVDDVAAGKTSL